MAKEGTTEAAKEHRKNAIIALQNEIVSVYLSEKHECGKVSMKRGRLRAIIAELKEKRNLGDVDVVFRIWVYRKL